MLNNVVGAQPELLSTMLAGRYADLNQAQVQHALMHSPELAMQDETYEVPGDILEPDRAEQDIIRYQTRTDLGLSVMRNRRALLTVAQQLLVDAHLRLAAAQALRSDLAAELMEKGGVWGTEIDEESGQEKRVFRQLKTAAEKEEYPKAKAQVRRFEEEVAAAEVVVAQVQAAFREVQDHVQARRDELNSSQSLLKHMTIYAAPLS